MSPSTALSEARHVLEPYLSTDNTLNTTSRHRSTHQGAQQIVTNHSDIDRAVKALFRGLVMWARIARSVPCISSPESSVESELMHENDDELGGRDALIVGRVRSIKGKNRDEGFVLRHYKLDMPTLVSLLSQMRFSSLSLVGTAMLTIPTRSCNQNELLFLLVKLHLQGLLERASDGDLDSDTSKKRRRLSYLRLIDVISKQLRNIAQTPMTSASHEASKMSSWYLVRSCAPLCL
jgi:hypothetical protein